MAAAHPPNADPPPETLDSSLVDETAPPMRSPLAGALPFGPPRPHAPARPAAPPPAFRGLPGPTPRAAAPPGPPPAAPFGEETAPAERSPLAAALPFRHAKPFAATVALSAPSADDLRQMPQPAAGAASSPAALARAKLELAKTVGFAMPPVSAVPPGGGPVAAASTGHFGLSIEQYAALCAEVAVFPASAEAIFAKYGLAAQKDRLTADLAWQDRLRADEALMQRWQTLYLHYHEYHYGLSARR